MVDDFRTFNGNDEKQKKSSENKLPAGVIRIIYIISKSINIKANKFVMEWARIEAEIFRPLFIYTYVSAEDIGK